MIKGDGSVQEEGGLKVYPKPMFDFKERRQVCINKLKKAYDVGMYGDDEKVKDGTWKEVVGYMDKSRRVRKDETNGIVDGGGNGRKRVRGDTDDGELENDGGENKVEEKPPPKKGAMKRSKKQATLDAHIGPRKVKR